MTSASGSNNQALGFLGAAISIASSSSPFQIDETPVIPASMTQNTLITPVILTVSNAPGAVTWSMSGQPTGININSGSGRVAGTPTVSGDFTATVTAQSGSSSASAQYPITVAGATVFKILASPAVQSTMTIGTPVTGVTLATSGSVGTVSWSQTGAPAGVVINSSTGAVSGNPTTANSPGSFSMVVTATDSSGPTTATRTYSITLSAAAAVFSIKNTPTLPSSLVRDQPMTEVDLATVNGVTPITWATNGGRPPGIDFTDIHAGKISGTPTTVGSYSYSVKATDSTPQDAFHTYNIDVVAPAMAITDDPTLDGTYLKSADFPDIQLAVTDSVGTVTWTQTGKPAGTTFSAGKFSSTTGPTTLGSYSMVVTATDSSTPTAQVATKTYSITISNSSPSKNPWTRKFGIARGNPATSAMVTTTLTKIAGGTNKCIYVRHDAPWTMAGGNANGVPTDAQMAKTKTLFQDEFVANGVKGLLLFAYTAPSQQRTITFQGSNAAGSNVITWNGGVGSGIDAQVGYTVPNGYYAEGKKGLSIHGPGIPEGVVNNVPVSLITAQSGTTLTISSTITQQNNSPTTYTIGGSSYKDPKMQCQTPKNYGLALAAAITYFGTTIMGVEMGNEENWFMGGLPFADPTQSFKKWCYGYAYAKATNPNLIIVPCGAAAISTNQKGANNYFMWEWYAALCNEALGNGNAGASYFKNALLDAGFATTDPIMNKKLPFDAVACHTYTGTTLPGPAATSMDHMAKSYNSCVALDPDIMIMPTEEGPAWPSNFTAVESGTWITNYLDYCWGNRYWDLPTALTGHYGGILSNSASTLVARQDAAQRLFLPPTFFCVRDPMFEGYGMWTSANPPVQKWNDNVHDMMYAMVNA
jgi:hypothetical protein